MSFSVRLLKEYAVLRQLNDQLIIGTKWIMSSVLCRCSTFALGSSSLKESQERVTSVQLSTVVCRFSLPRFNALFAEENVTLDVKCRVDVICQQWDGLTQSVVCRRNNYDCFWLTFSFSHYANYSYFHDNKTHDVVRYANPSLSTTNRGDRHRSRVWIVLSKLSNFVDAIIKYHYCVCVCVCVRAPVCVCVCVSVGAYIRDIYSYT